MIGSRATVRNARTRLYTRLRYLRSSGSLRRRVLVIGGGMLVLGVLWIAVTGYLARQQVQRLETRLQQVKSLVASGDVDAARRVSSDIPALATRAHRLTTGPAWWLAAQIPYAGDPLEVIRGATAAAQQVGADSVPALLQIASRLDPTKLRTSGATINTAALVAAAPQLSSAAATIDAAISRIDNLPRTTWLNAVDRPRASLSAQLTSIGGYLDAASRAATVLPSLLGDNRPKRYFIGLQNEAELRGTGGLPGAFAIMVANHGTIKFTHFESDAALLPPTPDHLIDTGLNFGRDYTAAYGASAPSRLIVNSNISPHFPYAAQIWARMWQKTSGERVDGAFALDPTVLSYVLAVTGPVRLPGGAPLTAQNVVSLTQRDEYTIFPNNFQRKAFLVSILKAASNRLTSGAGSATQLLTALSQASQQQRLLVWTSDAKTEAILAQTNYAGAIPQSTRPLVGLALNNSVAGKLDFYLTRSLTYHRSGCGSTRDVLVTIALTNTAPATGLPPYVNSRLDKHAYPVKPGDNRTLLDYYATDGAQLLSAALNDKPITIAVEHGLGHPIFRLDVELPRGTTQTIVLHLQEPAGDGEPQVWHQPGVTPLGVTFYSQPCG
ncbi:MAG: hypothetical protein DLM57_06970 [Pseudonocardiales bacterium]|nr:MAG: hypothetical protein DLM57_06970 [Pseudonocardiales bacterium]